MPMNKNPAEVCSDLFQPVRLGSYSLANRIVMAPLTRSRAGADGVPQPLMAEYYAQRASAGLIIAEGTNISPQGRGYAFTPGLYDDAQVEGWRPVIESVHVCGGRIFPQLSHVGRVVASLAAVGRALPVAPSAIRPEATSYTGEGFRPCVTPRALSTDEIPLPSVLMSSDLTGSILLDAKNMQNLAPPNPI
jgi:N-ethylmaleimide reductase